MGQKTMLGVEERLALRRSDLMFSVDDNQERLIASIMLLHTEGIIEADISYGKGTFYKGRIPRPELCFDIDARVAGVIKADSCSLPLDREAVSSIMWDPPFLVTTTGNYKMSQLYGGAENVRELWNYYRLTVGEIARVLKKQGVAIVKSQDVLSGRSHYMSHAVLIDLAICNGLYVKDIFLLINKNVIVSRLHLPQQHARKSHCYFLVLKKSKRKSEHIKDCMPYGIGFLEERNSG